MERIFHVDPDGGNGMFELAILVFLVVAVAMIALRLRGRIGGRAAERVDKDDR